MPLWTMGKKAVTTDTQTDRELKSDGLVGGALIADGGLFHLGAWSAAHH